MTRTRYGRLDDRPPASRRPARVGPPPVDPPPARRVGDAPAPRPARRGGEPGRSVAARRRGRGARRVPGVGRGPDLVADSPSTRVPPPHRGLRLDRRHPWRAAAVRLPAARAGGSRGPAHRGDRVPWRAAGDASGPGQQPRAGRPVPGARPGCRVGVRRLGPGARHHLHADRRRVPAGDGAGGQVGAQGARQRGVPGAVRRVPPGCWWRRPSPPCQSPTRSWQRRSPRGPPCCRGSSDGSPRAVDRSARSTSG